MISCFRLKRAACMAALDEMISSLSGALIVWNSFCFRRSGILRENDQDDQRNDIGHHIIDGAGQIQLLKERETGIDIAQAPEQTEQQRCQRDAEGFPCAEDHDRQRKESKAGHAVFKLPLRNSCCDVD